MAYFFNVSDIWPKAFDSDAKLDLLANNEHLVICPYDKSHRAINTKFSSHLMKCRRNYQDWRLQDGEPILLVSCRYFPEHKVLPPELELHEAICQNDHMKGANLVQIIYDHELQRFNGPWQNWEPSEKAKAAFKILKHEPVPPAFVPEGVVLSADLTDILCAAENWTLSCKMRSTVTGNSEMVSISSRRPTRARYYGAADLIGLSSDEIEEMYWNAPAKTSFDWKRNWMHLEMPIQSCPPGMSKLHRKMWIEHNAIRLKTERGIFLPEDDGELLAKMPERSCMEPPSKSTGKSQQDTPPEKEDTGKQVDSDDEEDW